jgi:hypothetical protein
MDSCSVFLDSFVYIAAKIPADERDFIPSFAQPIGGSCHCLKQFKPLFLAHSGRHLDARRIAAYEAVPVRPKDTS